MSKKIYKDSGEAEKARYKNIADARKRARIVTHKVLTPAKKRKRTALEKDLVKWLKFFNAPAYTLPFSDDHLKVIAKVQKALENGGLFCNSMPRGSGKTTILLDCLLFSVLTGKKKFPFVIAADKSSAVDILDAVKIALQFNEKLHEYYPEVTTYFKALEGRSQKAKGQLNEQGESTLIQFKSDTVVFPNVKGSRCSESCIKVEGLGGSIRGKRFATSTGENLRPDFVFIDDPSTAESAASVKQNSDRLDLIRKDVLALAGPTTKISCVIACTVINEGDLSSQLLDRELNPEFQGERFQLVNQWPANAELWEQYSNQYEQELREEIGHKKSLAFYKKNKKEMDAGVKVAWPERFIKGEEISGIQYAYNLIARIGEDAFHCEYQNQPLTRKDERYKINETLVCSRLNKLERFQLPDESEKLVSFTDINFSGCHYVVMSCHGNAVSCVVDWGKYPKAKDLIPNPETTNDAERDALIWEGLRELHSQLSETHFMRDGERVQIDLSLVDIGGRWGKLVSNWCKQARFRGIGKVFPSRGVANNMYKQTNVVGFPGDGFHIANWKHGKIQSRVLIHNTDVFRVRAQKAFLGSPLNNGTISLYGDKPKEHLYYAKHICGETLDKVEGRETGDKYYWSQVKGADHDLLDSTVGCLVAAAACGVGQRMHKAKKRKPKRQRKFTSTTI